MLPRGSPFDSADSESLLRLRRAKKINARITPRVIKATGTATAACIPGEHMPVHDLASEETSAKPLVVEAAAAEVKEVLSVDTDVIELDNADPVSVRVFDVAPAEAVCDGKVWAVELDKPGDLVDAVLPAATDLEGVVVSVSAGPVVTTEPVAAGDAIESTLGVGVKNVCVDRKFDMAAGRVFENSDVKGRFPLLFDIVFPNQAFQASFT